jgi:hypothetical protein
MFVVGIISRTSPVFVSCGGHFLLRFGLVAVPLLITSYHRSATQELRFLLSNSDHRQSSRGFAKKETGNAREEDVGCKRSREAIASAIRQSLTPDSSYQIPLAYHGHLAPSPSSSFSIAGSQVTILYRSFAA